MKTTCLSLGKLLLSCIAAIFNPLVRLHSFKRVLAT